MNTELPPSAAAIAPSKDWTETVAPDEGERFERLAAVLAALQRERASREASKGRDGRGRALHFKAHGGLLASFDVLDDVPGWARVGIFATPQALPAYLRFSSGSGAWQPDSAPDIRGMAVKVVGVPGKKLIPALAGAHTQDFLANHTETVPFRTPDEFVGLVQALAGPRWRLLPQLVRLFGLRTPSLLRELRSSLGQGAGSVAELTMYSTLPIRWGEHAVKFRFVPQRAPALAAQAPDERDKLRQQLAAWLAEHSLSYEMQIQPYLEPERTPIEDATRAWDSPWVAVARVQLPVQDPSSERGKRIAAYVESLSFDPWHAPEAFRPLGALMRARSPAYRESTLARGAAPEPDGTEQWGADR